MRAARRRFAIGFVALPLAGAAAQSLQFSEQTDATGLDCTHDRPEPTTRFFGGGATGDFDRDGWQDLFVLMGGVEPDRLYMNNGDGTFRDEAASWGVAVLHRGAGAAVGDFNGDGFLDLFVTSDGPPDAPTPGAHRLYRNNGDRSFSEIAAQAGVAWTSPDEPDGFSAAFGDYDLDGDLDLAVTAWNPYSGGNRLFRNNGDETFSDVTTQAIPTDLTPVRGYSPRFHDMNGDGLAELLWVADFRTTVYLVNNGDGTFTDRTIPAGVGIERNGMGQTVGDFDNDGLPDWYVSSIFADAGPIGARQGSTLYRNLGAHQFEERAESAGVINGGWGWGCVAVDLNHDGWVDLAETNGWAPIEWQNEQSYLYLNRRDFTFDEVALDVGFEHFGQGRGLLNCDYDGDGDQDLVLFAWREPMRIFRNDLHGPDANWLRVFLDSCGRRDIAPDGIGARVEAITPMGTQTRWIESGSNYLSQSEMSAHFGLGGLSSVAEIRVRWPDGRTTTIADVGVNQTLTIAAPLPGDLDADQRVDLADLSDLLSAFDACEGDPAFAPHADLNGDGCVGLEDLVQQLRSFGLSCGER